jgi:hypothetical protein
MDGVMVGMGVAVFIEVGVAGREVEAQPVSIKTRMVKTSFFISSSSDGKTPIHYCSMGCISLKVKNILNVIRFLP